MSSLASLVSYADQSDGETSDSEDETVKPEKNDGAAMVESAVEVLELREPQTTWQQVYDPNTGYPYYWNQVNNEITWDPPEEYMLYLSALNDYGMKVEQKKEEERRQKEREKQAKRELRAKKEGAITLISSYGGETSEESESEEEEKETKPKPEITYGPMGPPARDISANQKSDSVVYGPVGPPTAETSTDSVVYGPVGPPTTETSTDEDETVTGQMAPSVEPETTLPLTLSPVEKSPGKESSKIDEELSQDSVTIDDSDKKMATFFLNDKSDEEDDLMSLLENEKPPDYYSQEAKSEEKISTEPVMEIDLPQSDSSSSDEDSKSSEFPGDQDLVSLLLAEKPPDYPDNEEAAEAAEESQDDLFGLLLAENPPDYPASVSKFEPRPSAIDVLSILESEEPPDYVENVQFIFLKPVVPLLKDECVTKMPDESEGDVTTPASEETPAETPAEIPTETPAEIPTETPAENPAETPAENPAYEELLQEFYRELGSGVIESEPVEKLPEVFETVAELPEAAHPVDKIPEATVAMEPEVGDATAKSPVVAVSVTDLPEPVANPTNEQVLTKQSEQKPEDDLLAQFYAELESEASTEEKREEAMPSETLPPPTVEKAPPVVPPVQVTMAPSIKAAPKLKKMTKEQSRELMRTAKTTFGSSVALPILAEPEDMEKIYELPSTSSSGSAKLEYQGGGHRGFGFHGSASDSKTKKGFLKFKKGETLVPIVPGVFEMPETPPPPQVETSVSEKIDGSTQTEEKHDKLLDPNLTSVLEDLVERLVVLEVEKLKVDPLKILALQADTLFGAWQEGALQASYLQHWLGKSCSIMERYEKCCVAPVGWNASWDSSNRRYAYENVSTGEIQYSKPEVKVQKETPQKTKREDADVTLIPTPGSSNAPKPARGVKRKSVPVPPPPRVRPQSPPPPPPPLIDLAPQSPIPVETEEPSPSVSLPSPPSISTSLPQQPPPPTISYTIGLAPPPPVIYEAPPRPPPPPKIEYDAPPPPGVDETEMEEKTVAKEKAPGPAPKKARNSEAKSKKKTSAFKMFSKWQDVQKQLN